ncbi:MAG: PP2C family protein-serine/threonine phosphatase, partial [Acidimicrobiales bacterium]
YTLLGEGPARVLELTDHKVAHFEMGVMITVICGRSYPPFDRWAISSAGHPPPVLSAPDRPSILADVPPGPPLGVQPSSSRAEFTVLLPPNGLLFLYTDGLVERRGEDLESGLERLRGIVYPGPPELVCRTVMHELVGSHSPVDDIAVLAVRRGSPQDPPTVPL